MDLEVRVKLAAVLLALAMAGCTPSLNSLSTEQDRTFDAALLGAWRSAVPDDTDRFEVSRGKEGAYRVVLLEKKHVGVFTARLVSIGPHRFVDLFPEDHSPDGFFQAHFIPVHTFGKITLEGGRMRLGMLNPDWFGTPEGKKAGLPFVARRGGGILMASTAQLREFAARFAESKAFDDSEDGAVWVKEK
jgi:hypothetical protein